VRCLPAFEFFYVRLVAMGNQGQVMNMQLRSLFVYLLAGIHRINQRGTCIHDLVQHFLFLIFQTTLNLNIISLCYNRSHELGASDRTNLTVLEEVALWALNIE
jgi:hypothetical protein